MSISTHLDDPATGQPDPGAGQPPGHPLRHASWEEIRGLFALDADTIHLNTGTVGAMPYEVLDTLDRVTREWTGGLLDVYLPTLFTEQRAAIGRAFGVDQDELVISHSATEGVARVIQGLDLREGDEVITTTHDCYSVQSNFNLLRNRHGITMKVLTLPSGYDTRAEDIVELFAQAITPRTKILAFAAITLFTGTLMPMRQLCELAHRHGLTTVVDGALLPGMLDCDMRATGADFISCSGAKFQCGPLGTALLYIRNKVHPEHNPLPLPDFWPVISTLYPMMGEPPPRTRTSTESYNIGDFVQGAGSGNIARGHALARACQIWDQIGRDRIERRIMRLGDYARERVADRFGTGALYSPGADPRLRSPLIAFNPFPGAEDSWHVKKVDALVKRLQSEHRIWTRWTEFDVPGSPHQHYAIRICTHLFNNHHEIDHSIEVIARLAAEA